ncbi:MAG: FtsW/RodA/SpoVE family cell cycle protein [Candidatus Eremiobacteraeota bacterium]|nr:FtsW/RodA/SpoVE family cell cycle protein [Candidatus Eremiobacteraeota bacterium]
MAGKRLAIRKTERILLIFLFFIYLAGMVIVHYSRHERFDSAVLLMCLPLVLSMAAVHIVLSLTGSRADELVFPLVCFLCMTGHIEIYRLEPSMALKQAIFLVIGFLLFIGWYTKGLDYRAWEDYKYLVLLAGIAIQLAVMVLGIEINGAKLWFTFGDFNFQPVEVVKILAVIFLASYLKQKKEFIISAPRRWFDMLSFKYLVPLLLIWGCCELILVVQKDLGMALLLFGTFMCIFYVATQRTGMIFIGFLLFFAGSWVVMHRFPHVHVRFSAWLDPWQDPAGSGYQTIQALFALASGGFTGTGLGMGTPGLIPAVHTDYVFAAIGEELGFLGALAVIVAYLLLVERIFRISMAAFDEFGILLCTGLGSLLACQILIIVGGSTKFIPMTGITLPFISYGGSSVLANFFLIALVFQVSHLASKKRRRMMLSEEGQGGTP